MAVVCSAYYFIVVWTPVILTQQLGLVSSYTFELPDRYRMCFFEDVEIGRQCYFEFQV